MVEKLYKDYDEKDVKCIFAYYDPDDENLKIYANEDLTEYLPLDVVRNAFFSGSLLIVELNNPVCYRPMAMQLPSADSIILFGPNLEWQVAVPDEDDSDENPEDNDL